MEARFTAEGFEVSAEALRARLGGKGYTALLSRLTVRERPQPGAPPGALRGLRTHRCYAADPERLRLPRRVGWALVECGALAAADVLQEPGEFGGARRPVRWLPEAAREAAAPLYAYQRAYVDHVAGAYLGEERRRRGQGQVYVHAGTGSGKTFMMLGLVAKMGVPTVVLVPTVGLQRSGIRDAAAMLPGARTVAYSNDLARRELRKGRPEPSGLTHDVVFCVYNTARKKDCAFFESYGMVVLDEAHEVCAAKTSELLWLAQAPCVVGLSATPDERVDGMDKVVCRFLGEPVSLESVVPADMLQDTRFDGHVREVCYEGDPAYAENVRSAAGSMSAIETVGSVVADPRRLELVAAEVERLLHMHNTLPPDELAYWSLGPDPQTGTLRRHCVFVFAEHRGYLPRLREALLRRVAPEELSYQDPGDDVEEAAGIAGPVVLRGGASEAEQELAGSVRVVLTTYGYSRRGVSYKQMTALVAASPRRNGLTQILGRICRTSPDKALLSIRRCVVDVRDVSTGLDNQSSSRRVAYRAKAWPIFQVTCSHRDFPDGAPALEGEAPVKERAPRAPRAAAGACDADEVAQQRAEVVALLGDLAQK